MEKIKNHKIKKLMGVVEMGFLDLEYDVEIVRKIKRRLKKRGLVMDTEEVWEVHGPHPDMPFQVFIGYAFVRREGKCICPYPPEFTRNDCPVHGYVCVALYPRAVYEIESPSKWWDISPENRIPVE